MATVPLSVSFTHPPTPLASLSPHLKRVVLRRHHACIVIADEGYLLQNIALDSRDAVEEEEGEDARDATEACG